MNAYGDARVSQQTVPPGTLTAWAVIAIGGSLLASLFGIVIVIVGAALGSNPDMQARIANALASSGATITVSRLTSIITAVGFLVLIYGIVWAAVNWLLYREMARRQQWAWIVAVVLLGIGMVIDLIGHGGGSLVHLVVIQVPLAVLLLLTPTREWVGAGGGPAAATVGYPAPPPPMAAGPAAYTPPAPVPAPASPADGQPPTATPGEQGTPPT
jgi:uncharacterized membrane protein YciS (DUF1049 family)